MKILILFILILGCSAKELKPDAPSISLVKTKPGSSCKYLGKIHGNQGNFFTGDFTSVENLEKGAENSLKNEAFSRGANTVHVIEEMWGHHGSYGSRGDKHFLGDAYSCPR